GGLGVRTMPRGLGFDRVRIVRRSGAGGFYLLPKRNLAKVDAKITIAFRLRPHPRPLVVPGLDPNFQHSKEACSIATARQAFDRSLPFRNMSGDDIGPLLLAYLEFADAHRAHRTLTTKPTESRLLPPRHRVLCRRRALGRMASSADVGVTAAFLQLSS